MQIKAITRIVALAPCTLKQPLRVTTAYFSYRESDLKLLKSKVIKINVVLLQQLDRGTFARVF